MKDLFSLLDETDPLRRQPELTRADALRMRSAIVHAARQRARSSALSSGTWALAAAVVLTVIAGTIGGRQPSIREPSKKTPTTMSAAVEGERRQLQFATPGGTRVIWTLDPNFQLREVEP